MKANLFRRREFIFLAAALLLGALLRLPFPFRDALLVAAAIACAVFAARHFASVWLVVLGVLPLIRLSGELFSLNGVTLSRFVVVALAMVFLFTLRDQDVLRALGKTNGLRWFGLFVVVNVISAIVVRQAAAVLSALTYLEPLLFFAITYCLVRLKRVTTREILGVLLLGAVLVALGGVYEWATQQALGKWFDPALTRMLDTYMSGYDSNRFGLGGRISSFIAQPVFAGLYWVMMLCIALYYFNVSARARWLQAAWLLMALVLVVLSGTRSALLALAAVWLVWVALGLQNARQRALALAVTGAGAIGLVLVSPTLANYLRASLEPNPDAIAARNVIWRIAVTGGLLDVFASHWLFGYGPGMLLRQSVAGKLPRVNGRYPLGGMENQYASLLAEGGIFAGAAYALFMFGAARDCVRMLCHTVLRAQGVLLAALFAAYFVFAMTSWTMTEIPNLILMTVYGALIADFETQSARQV